MDQPVTEITGTSKSRTYRRIKHSLWVVIFLSIGWMVAGEFHILGINAKFPADVVAIFSWSASIIVQYFSGEEIATGSYLKIPAGQWDDGLRLFTLLFGIFMFYIGAAATYLHFFR